MNRKGGFFQTGLLLYLALALAITMAAPSVVFPSSNPAAVTVLSWFNLQYVNGSIVSQSGFSSGSGGAANQTFGSTSAPAGAGSILGFIDPIFQIFGFVQIIFSMLFSPIILFTSPALGMPWPITLFIAVPIVFMMVVGLIIWIRSGFP